jgi:DNA (cytosine-5)-methyltransferase 1
MTDSEPAINLKPSYIEFFAGSGLVAHALKPYFKTAWANDICEKKAVVYIANHGNKNFELGSIVDMVGSMLPTSPLSWASFPCQDLSLAGLVSGIHGERSGLVWEWLRVIDEMNKKPEILVAENVTGLVSVDEGSQYRMLHEALRSRGYLVGAIMLDAVRWLPQSRQRIFVVAVKRGSNIPSNLITKEPNWLHPKPVINAATGLQDWVWWNLPEPKPRKKNISDIVELDAICDDANTANHNLSLISNKHLESLRFKDITVATGYKRTRDSKQVLELRFDGVAGCLRTPKGGSSRQLIVIKRGGNFSTRLLTIRETARLMGAPDTFKIPGTYNEGYKAMGDGVAVPVARWLARHLLLPLVKAND